MSAPLFSPASKQRLRDLTNRTVASLPSIVTLRQKTGHDRYGPTWGAPATYTVMLTYQQRVVTNAAGEQVDSTGSLLFRFPPPVVGPEDELTLPDDTKPPIKGVQRDPSPDPVIPTVVFI